jgi:glycosyltransferase involved in cell wall biosynthesis
MRIALMHPTYWPEVRRGSERLVHDAAVALHRRGHQVSIVTTHPGPTEESLEDGVHVLRARRPPGLPRTGDQELFVETAPGSGLRLIRGEYDLAHAFFPVDAWAAVKARGAGGPPVAFSFHGIPVREYLVNRRRRLDLISAAARDADAVSVLSAAAALPYRRYLLREPQVVPGGVFCADYSVDVPRAERPTLICAASLGDPRKGGRLLLEAFTLARERVPEARLLLAGGRDPFLSKVTIEHPEGVELIDGDDTAELAAAYGSAWASVLPAIGEAFGLVLIESLAAGTPTIALRSGACPEVIVDEVTGALVEPGDVPALAEAIVAALAAPPNGEVTAACRRRAREFDWEQVVGLYEDLHELALANGGSAAR